MGQYRRNVGDHQGVWLDDEQQLAWRVFLGSHARLLAELNRRLLEASGLAIADYEVLVHVSEAPDRRLRSFELADAMQWERSRLAHHLTRMTKRNLVVREPCEDDGRGSYVIATTAGRRALRRAAPHHAADVRELFVVPAGADLRMLVQLGARIDTAVRSEE